MDRGASLLMGLPVVHAGAALYHQFIRRDGLLQRIWHHR
jgi:cytochrome b561